MSRAFVVLVTASCFVGCSDPVETPTLMLYSGRSEALVQPVLDGFQAATGILVDVRYGGSAQLAAMILNEGAESDADVYYGQDAGALGSLARQKRLRRLPEALIERVDPRFRANDGRWVGTSGRARVLAYNTRALDESELPDSITELANGRWKGRVGWAPSNGSFHAFVTAMRMIDGEEKTRKWLERMVANEPKTYRDNSPLFEALIRGDIDVGLTNHYYLFRFLESTNADLPVRNYIPRGGGAGALVTIAGAGILDSAPHPEAAERFIEYLLSMEAQTYFARDTFEYPMIDGVAIHPLVTPLSEVRTPDVDLGKLDDLEGTLALLQEVGAL